MFTSNVIIYRSESFTVTSYGNGAGYAIDDHVREASFFIQDEERTQKEDIVDQATVAKAFITSAKIIEE